MGLIQQQIIVVFILVVDKYTSKNIVCQVPESHLRVNFPAYIYFEISDLQIENLKISNLTPFISLFYFSVSNGFGYGRSVNEGTTK
jgi:hypothetical protein